MIVQMGWIKIEPKRNMAFVVRCGVDDLDNTGQPDEGSRKMSSVERHHGAEALEFKGTTTSRLRQLHCR